MEPQHESEYDSDFDSDDRYDMMMRQKKSLDPFLNFKSTDDDLKMWWQKTELDLIRNLMPVDSNSSKKIDMVDSNSSMEADLDVPNKKKVILSTSSVKTTFCKLVSVNK